MRRRVVKIGGSLLLREDLVVAVEFWLAQQSPAETLVVVGGGELIDAVRRLDQVRPLDPVSLHWRCVALLDTTLEMAEQWFRWPSVWCSDEFKDAIANGFSTDLPTLISAKSFYRPDSEYRESDRLPHDWRTTTDSIAALLGILTRADEVALLKSCDVDGSEQLRELVDRGIVDGALPQLNLKGIQLRVARLP